MVTVMEELVGTLSMAVNSRHVHWPLSALAAVLWSELFIDY